MTDKRIVFSAAEIAARVRELGRRINADYRDKDLVVVCLLNGAFVFMADLVRVIDLPLEIDFIRLASYGSETVSCGEVRMSKDVEVSLAGRDVLLVEDIVDTGRTIAFLRDCLAGQNPRSVRLCALIDKRERREKEVVVDYAGFDVAEGFLVGYGLDFAGQHRHYPAIYHLVREAGKE